MEDILASIKRIIAEDGEAAAPPQPRLRRGPVPVPDPAPEPAAASGDEVRQPDTPPEADDAPIETAPERVPAAEQAPGHDDVLELTSPMVAPAAWHAASILSANAEQASRHAFAALQQARPEEPAPAPADVRSIEAFMADMLRPMLSEWLDSRLPAIVERIVTDEVKRISGRG